MLTMLVAGLMVRGGSAGGKVSPQSSILSFCSFALPQLRGTLGLLATNDGRLMEGSSWPKRAATF